MAQESSDRAVRHRRRFRYACAALLLAAGAGVAWAADEVVVKAKSAEILSGKSGLSGTVATVSKDDRLTVLAREKDWLKVRVAGGKEGYIKEGALSASSLTAGGRPVSKADTSGLSAGNAAKGIEKGAEDFARQNNISQQTVDAVNHQLDLRKALEAHPEEFQTFQQNGKVGSGR